MPLLAEYEPADCAWTPPGMTEGTRFYSMNYKKGCPPSQWLIASDGKRTLVLDSIGPSADYLSDIGADTVQHHLGERDPGIWIVVGDLRCGWFWTDIGHEYDEELECTVRPLTEDEWASYDEKETPWDAKDWGEPWEKPPADLPHDFLPHIETCTKCGECRQALDAKVI